MNRDIREELAMPYEDSDNYSDFEEQFLNRIGISKNRIDELEDMISSDLDDIVGGVKWWKDIIDQKRLILISDHMLQCISSIKTNLIEAKLYILEYEDYTQQVSTFYQDSLVVTRSGNIIIGSLPAMKSPLDNVKLRMCDLCVTGFFRSIGSALDCFSSAIVAVLALPIPLLLAGFPSIRNHFNRSIKSNDSGNTFQKNFWSEIENQETQCGPSGWLDWSLHYRNMLVHRARRLSVRNMQPIVTPIFKADGSPFVRAKSIPLLPQSPNISEMEIFVEKDIIPLLTEDGTSTIYGIYTSTTHFLNECSVILARAWTERRLQPDLLPQPVEQWKNIPSTTPIRFEGYNPGSIPFNYRQMHASPDFQKRLVRSKLTIDKRTVWDS